jgi:acyl carrier protein
VTPDDIKRVVVEALARIAPEVDGATLPDGVKLREEFDLDSMDFLNFVLALHDRLGVDIPEADYSRLSTLDGTVSYLAAKTADTPTRS